MNEDGNLIKEAHVVLAAHIKEIHTVQEWAEWMGFETSKQFSKQFLNYFGVRPGRVLGRARLIYIIELIRLKPELSGYEVARESGLRDEKALYDFLVCHSGLSFSQLRERLRGGR